VDGTPRTAEAHFRLGLIYHDHLQDPIGAVHHFRRYLEIDQSGPYSRQARSNIARSEVNMAPSLSGSTLINRQEATRIRSENLQLKQQLAVAKSAASLPRGKTVVPGPTDPAELATGAGPKPAANSPEARAATAMAPRPPPAGERRQVTVLFADIRGYSGYAERLEASEIFSTVNQYTRAVSTAVLACGGTVVEFNGDGMMAVFGAPRPLPDKERAGVRAARSIVAAVESLTLETSPREGHLSVGVGVASGSAYVGNIQAVDRLIWSAIGNTTNLAARLQALTRELDAAVALDAPTHAAARDECAGFLARRSVRIRGRDEPVDVYALPLGAGA